MTRHLASNACPKCAEKLADCHLAIRDWFWFVKQAHPDAHISCSFRGKQDQEIAFKAGKSKLEWPRSKHNRMLDGAPCSEAVDLFRLVSGVAVFEKDFFAEINKRSVLSGYKITWGGDWKSIGDSCHFELAD